MHRWRCDYHNALGDGRTRAALRSALGSGRSSSAAAERDVRAAPQGTSLATLPSLYPIEYTLVGSCLRSVRVFLGHTSHVHGVRHLFLKQARFSVSLLLSWTAACSGAKRVQAALAIQSCLIQ